MAQFDIASKPSLGELWASMEHPTVGRNEPCPCGSGKKFKRCCAAKYEAERPATTTAPSPAVGAANNPYANLDPAAMQQASQMLQRLPKGQLARLQSIMQKAMSGKDVTSEAKEFERTLPPEFMEMAKTLGAQMNLGQTMGATPAASPITTDESTPAMTEEEARRIVEEASKAGKLSKEEAETLLAAPATEKASGFKKLFKFGSKS